MKKLFSIIAIFAFIAGFIYPQWHIVCVIFGAGVAYISTGPEKSKQRVNRYINQKK